MKNAALILSLLILSGCLLVSCGESAPESSPAQETVPQDVISETEPETEALSGLAAGITPELKASLGLDGYDFKIYLRNEDGSWANKDNRLRGARR